MWGFRTRFWLLVAFLMVFAGSAHAVEAGDPVAVRISKSGVVRLADANREFSQHVTYLPAGKRLVLFLPTATVGKRKWQLAMTDDGLFIYVQTNGLHYYNLGSRAAEYGQRLAVIKREIEVDQEGSTVKRRLGPSEIYTVVDESADKWKIYQPAGGTSSGEFSAWVPDAAVSVFDTSDLDVSPADSSNFAFVQQTFASSVSAAIEKLRNKGISGSTIAAIKNFLTFDVITTKQCYDTLTIKPIEISGDVSLNIKEGIWEVLSPISAQVGASASFKVETVYPAKLEFEVTAASRESADGTPVLYSIRTQAIRTDCAAGVQDRRVTIQREGRMVVEINDQLVENLNLKMSSTGYLSIPCREYYFKLYDILMRESGASADVISYLIAHFTSFAGEDASVCPAQAGLPAHPAPA